MHSMPTSLLRRKLVLLVVCFQVTFCARGQEKTVKASPPQMDKEMNAVLTRAALITTPADIKRGSDSSFWSHMVLPEAFVRVVHRVMYFT